MWFFIGNRTLLKPKVFFQSIKNSTHYGKYIYYELRYTGEKILVKNSSLDPFLQNYYSNTHIINEL